MSKCDRCPKCNEPFGESGELGGVCTDCWPGYNLCNNQLCDHYRCEHAMDDNSCMNSDCECQGFVEGSSRHIITRKEFAALRKSWESPNLDKNAEDTKDISS